MLTESPLSGESPMVVVLGAVRGDAVCLTFGLPRRRICLALMSVAVSQAAFALAELTYFLQK